MNIEFRDRQSLINTARAMNRLDLNHGACGNVSKRLAGGMLITPSGMSYETMQAKDVILVTQDGQWEPGRRPSSEWLFHRDIYAQRDDAGAVLHAHAPWCTTLACLQRGIPPFHYMIAAAGNDIRCAAYATFGSQELSVNALAALAGRRACLLANHGLLCLASDLEQVLDLALEVEFLARVYCQTLALGIPDNLDDEEMARVADKFRSYGANIGAGDLAKD